MPNTTPDFVIPNELLRVHDVAARLSCSPRYVTHLVARQMIAHIKFGRMIRFRESHVTEFLAKHSVEIFKQPEKKTPCAIEMRMGRF